MSDERTVSIMTLLNNPRRNRQDLSTIVDQVQIRQFYDFDPKRHAEQQANRPTPRFSTLKRYRRPAFVTDPIQSDEDDEAPLMSVDNWLSGPSLTEEDDDEEEEDAMSLPVGASSFSETLHSVLGELNPGSTILRELLADEDRPIDVSIPTQSVPVPVQDEEDDDEYPSL